MFELLEVAIDWPRPPERLGVGIKAGEEFVLTDVLLDGVHRVRVSQGIGVVLKVGTLQQIAEHNRHQRSECLQHYQVLVPYTELADGG